MNWYKIKTEFCNEPYTYGGCSPFPLEELAKRASNGEYIRLDELLYWDGNRARNWVEWNATEVPTVKINPTRIIAIQPFLDDPRKLQAIGEAFEEQMGSA